MATTNKLTMSLLSTLLVFAMGGCTCLTTEVYFDEHPGAQETTAIFEGFRWDDPYYSLCLDSSHVCTHLWGVEPPVVDRGDDSYVGLAFKAYYDPAIDYADYHNVGLHDFWVCLDELILPQSSTLMGYSTARLTKAFQSRDFAFVKYYIKGYDDEGQEGTIACEEHLPLELLDKLKQCKRDNQAVWVSIYTNPINPKRPISRIIRESIGNADEYRRFLTQE